MKPYPNYKPSGVAWLGDVPGHWGAAELKRLFRLVNGSTPSSGEDSYWDGDLVWVTPADLGRLGDKSLDRSERTLTYEGLANCGASMVPAPSIVISTRAPIGHLAIGTVSLCTNQGCRALIPLHLCDVRYFYYLLALGKDELQSRGQGTTFLELSTSSLGAFEVCIPTPQEQQAIADYLDTETTRIDALIREKVGLIGLLGERRAGVFETLLSEKALDVGGQPNPRFPWLTVLPTDWSCLKVKHIVQSLDQGISPQCEARVPDEDEWGVLKVGCVNSGVFNPNESKALPPEIDPIQEITLHEGDVLVSRANTKHLVGRAAMADKAYPKLMLSDKLYRLKLDTARCLPAFLVGFLTLPAIRVRIEERATGASASMLNIDRRTIMDLDMPLPPIARQLEIVAIAKTESAEIGALLSHVTAEIALLKELRAATIADAVLGRVDVRSGNIKKNSPLAPVELA